MCRLGEMVLSDVVEDVVWKGEGGFRLLAIKKRLDKRQGSALEGKTKAGVDSVGPGHRRRRQGSGGEERCPPEVVDDVRGGQKSESSGRVTQGAGESRAGVAVWPTWTAATAGRWRWKGAASASRQRAPSGDGECRVCRQKRVGEFFNRSQDAGRKSSDGTGTCQQKRIVRRDCVNPLSPPISHRIGCVVSGAARPVSWHPENTCGCFALPGVRQWQLAASRVSTLSPVAKAKPSKNTTASPLCNGSAFPASLPWLPLFSTTDPSSRDDTRLPHSRSTLTCPGIFFVFTNITPRVINTAPESPSPPRSQTDCPAFPIVSAQSTLY